MKAKRTPLVVKDFSGGQNTNPPQTDVDPKFSPDCLNVYAEGNSLRKRFGTNHLNSSSAGTVGNGIYNWVLSGSQQYLIALFDSTLKQMSVSGNTWSGTWSTVSADSAGTSFSNSIMHFVTYQGTLIMTTEARDKPQRMTPTDTKYKNIDSGGTGIAPLAKYAQVWKEHVFFLNIAGGGQLTEDCVSLSSWTTLDVANGATTTTTTGGLQVFKFAAGLASGSDAHIKRTLSSLTTSYSVEIKTYFSSISAITGGDYAYMDIANGVVRFRTRWSQDGLETFNGTTWLKVGVNTVSTGTWTTWKYLVTAGTATAATVDIFKDGAAAGLQFSVANASAASSGQLDLACNAGGSLSTGLWYMDYIYVNPISVRNNYFTDGLFASWVSSSQASYTDNVLPTTPLIHYKLNDNAGNSTVTDNGTLASNAGIYANATTINSSAVSAAGKINNSFSFTSASSHNIQLSSTSVTSMADDAVGTVCFWSNITDVSSVNLLLNLGDTDGDNVFQIRNEEGSPLGGLRATLRSGGNTILSKLSSGSVFTAGSWAHIGLVGDGSTLTAYVNGATVGFSVGAGTDGRWFSSVPNIDNGRIGCQNFNNSGNTQFLSGKIDDFRYSSLALNSSEIQAIYAEGNGNEGHPVTVREGTTIYTGTFSYRVNNDGQYAVVSQTLSSSALIAGSSLIFGAFINATNLSTYKLRVNDGTSNYDSAVLTANGTWQYQTLTFTPMSGSTAIRAQVISLSSSTIFIDLVGIVNASIGAIQDLSDRMQRSVSGTYDTWTGGDSGTNDITSPGDIGLRGSFILQDRMYVMKSWNIYRITYTSSIPLLDIKQAVSVVGTRSPRSVVNITQPGQLEIVIFLGTDRNIYMFDGFSLESLSDDIQLNNNMSQVYTNNINPQALDKVFAVNHSNISCYEIFLPIGDSTTPTHSLFFNYKTKAWWPFDNRNFLSGSVSDDASGERVIVVVGGTNGISYEINSDKTTSDDGIAINAYWNSFKLGEDYILGKQDQILVAGDSVTATPLFGWRSNYETTYINKTLPANTNQNVFDPAREANLIQFRVGDNSTGAIWKIWHIKGLEKGLGVGG